MKFLPGQVQAPSCSIQAIKIALVYSSVGIAIFVGWMLLARLATMSFSQEHQSYWILKSAPVSPRQLVSAKFLVAYLPTILLGFIFLTVIILLQGVSLDIWFYGLFVITLSNAGLGGINIAFGVAGARFDWKDPRKMTNAATGCSSSLVSMIYMIINLSLFFAPPILFAAIGYPSSYGHHLGWNVWRDCQPDLLGAAPLDGSETHPLHGRSCLPRLEMSNIQLRSYRPADEPAIIEITYKTGFKGEDLTGRGYCEDARLWYLIFIGYYARYEPEHFFVAVESNSNKVVGFICGTPDTLNQEAIFRKHMVPRIKFRLFGFTSWRYPRSFKKVLEMMRWVTVGTEDAENDPIIAQYPAHLHINILPGFQGQGIGSQLINRFEEHIATLGAKGIHLGTTNQNKKAVPFYHKMGFEIVQESEIIPQPEFDDFRYLMFAKHLITCANLLKPCYNCHHLKLTIFLNGGFPNV